MPAKPLLTRFAGPEDSPGFLLWRVGNAWQREQRQALQRFGLTHTQFVALATASWYGAQEPLTQARLAQLTGSDVMTTSQVVRALEAAGHFARLAHPVDARARVIETTRAGRHLAAEALKVVEATDAAFFASLGKDASRLVALFRRLPGGAAT